MEGRGGDERATHECCAFRCVSGRDAGCISTNPARVQRPNRLQRMPGSTSDEHALRENNGRRTLPIPEGGAPAPGADLGS